MVRSSSRRAFTLIELLVVIAIIAILAAILFPVFAQAREKARTTSCLSNFKQSATAIMMYTQDYDETMMPMTWEYGVWNFQVNQAWPQMTQPYVKNWQLYRCPSDPHATDGVLSDGATIQQEREFNWALRTDLGYNYAFLSPFVGPNGGPLGGAIFQPTTLAGINAPANTLMLADSIWDRSATGAPMGGGNWFIEAPCWSGATSYYWFGGWQFDNTASWLQFGGIFPRHTNMANIAFADGHVKAMNIGGIIAGCDVRSYTTTDVNAYIWDLQ